MFSPKSAYRVVAIFTIFALIVHMLPFPAAALTVPELPAVRQAIPATQPDALSHPIAVSRLQSSYVAGMTTIEFAITNNLPPTRQPDIPAGATITDTVQILASFVITSDVNTLRGLTLVDTLAAGVTLLSASGSPTMSGSTLTWLLPDLPPLVTVVVTMTVQTPAQGSDFIALDSGAQANAVRWGSPVNTLAAPAVLIPIGVDPAYTLPTVDADSHDRDVLWKSAEFTQEAQSLFALVRGFRNDPYAGSLRGARGTLWGQAGNSVDKSSLLIALLRGAGIPARYRHGVLETAAVQVLLASMFPLAAGAGGLVTPAAPVSDPLNDAALQSLVADHWWVEAYLPAMGWTDLDPSFPEALPGNTFALPGGSDRLTELPDSLRQKVTFTLEVEQYSQFPVGGQFLHTFTPLVATFSLPELAAQAVTFGHIVVSATNGGVYTSITHHYTPFFAVGGENFLTTGDEFQDLLTSFPFGTSFTTAEWLTIAITGLDGQTDTFRRELKDYIGLDARLNGGSPVIALPPDNRAFTDFQDAFATWFLPHTVDNRQYAERERAENNQAILEAAAALAHLPDDLATPESQAAFQQASLDYYLARNTQLSMAGLQFARLADPALQDLESNLRVKLFYDQPRLIITSSALQADDSVRQAMDLRTTGAAAIVYPGQALAAAFTANWAKAVAESYFEGQAIYQLTGESPLSVSRLFDELDAQGIQPVWVTPATMTLLDLYLPDTAAYAYAQQALLEGRHLLIPQSPVVVDGSPVLGWWEIDPQTGQAASVLADGLHGALIEYEMLVEMFGFAVTLNEAAGLQKSVASLWGCIARAAVPALQGNPGGPTDCVGGWSPPSPTPPWVPPLDWFAKSVAASPQALPSWRYLPAHLCPVDNCGVEQFALPFPDRSPVPLPEISFGYNDRFGGELWAGRVITVTDSGGGGEPAFSLAADPLSGSVLPGREYTFDISATANFDGRVDAWVAVPAGWQVRFDPASLQTQVVAAPGVPPGEYSLLIVAQARQDPAAIAVLQPTVSVPDDGSLYLGWQPEPHISVPVGDASYPAVSGQTNDGEAEIPASAYRLGVTNFSSQAKTLTLSVSGAPPDWVVLAGARQEAASFALGPNARAQFGLYVSPPALPAPGTAFDMLVVVSDGSSSASEVIPWSMPGQAFNYLTIEPEVIYMGASSLADFTVIMSNVGNAAGEFPLDAELPPVSAAIGNMPASLTLTPGAAQSFTATIQTTGVPIGARFPFVLGGTAPDSYTQYAQAVVQIVSPLSEPVFTASGHAAKTCTLGEPALSAALESLALAMVHLEASCQAGDPSLSLREQVVRAAHNVALYGGSISPGLMRDEALASVADQLAQHTASADILNDLQNLSAAVVDLDSEVCAWSAHMPVLQWTPYYGAALPGQPVTYTLELTNRGSLASTYALSVTLPAGSQIFSPALGPGESGAFEFLVSSTTLGLSDLEAAVTVAGQPAIRTAANARLNVVDQFVQITAVTADPPFVEPGLSATTITIDLANTANVYQSATAVTSIVDSSGNIVHTSADPLSILTGAPRIYPLHTVDTSGWSLGIYTVTVELRDASGGLIPAGMGYGYLGVGQSLGIRHAVEPGIVSPGDITVTTRITTEILTPALITELLGSGQTVAADLQFRLPDSTPASPLHSAPPTNQPASTTAITRTEDTSPALVYTGTWATVININSYRASNGDYTWSDDAGDTVAFAFNGTWLHIGFVTQWQSGQAEVFVDGQSLGIIDLYTRDNDVASFIFSGLADGSHNLEVVVLGTRHPNATGNQVRLDFIDTWDGTLYPDGWFEQDNPRVWRSADWVDVVDANASGGSYMRDGLGNTGTAWFPFTGDSLTFLAFRNRDAYRLAIAVDGIWQGNFLLYNEQPITDTLSFAGFGPGAHVMTLRYYFGEPNVDAFITPAVEAGYTPPVYTGIVRYEEDDPAISYNGYAFADRPQSWSLENATVPQVSDTGMARSSTAGDTASLTFLGSWVNIGFRTRNTGGLAEILVDGVSHGSVGLYSPGEDITSFQVGDLVTGTHTVTVLVTGQPDPPGSGTNVHLDYIEVWDGTAMPDDFANAHKAEESGRLHYSKSGVDAAHVNAIYGDYVSSGLPNTNSNIWYSFIGDSFTIMGLTFNNGGSAEVYLDDELIDTVSFDYPFSVQPYAFHYAGFGYGPHVVRVHNIWEMSVDGFVANPPNLNPYRPVVEWYDNAPAGNGAPIFGTVGIGAGMAAGDVNADGLVEIVVTADDVQNFGSLFVYRGDGADTGDGDPILWRHDFGGGAFRTWVGSPAIADLDGQPGAEIVVAAGDQLYAFHGDGTTYWVTDTVSIFETLSSPAIGNLDDDPEPEIVVNVGSFVEIRAHDGALIASLTYPNHANPPVLADLTGDGRLDILVTGWDDEVLLYDFNFGSPQVAWSTVLPTSMAGTFGAPAAADIDGLQPGGDPGPEVAVSSHGWLSVLDADGGLVWASPLAAGNPGGVSIADLDGDGEVEILTGMRTEFEPGRWGKLYVLNADGSLLWEAIAEDSSSANNASVLDLDADGIYEVAWNGREQGFTIFSGLDGAVLFNEPLVYSLTGTDYPLIVDVDNDGQAEVVSAALFGVRVFGNGAAWGPARPLWNEHSYHITNINDDLSVPFNELNSWEVHNTYRTQTPLVSPLPTFAIALTHTVAVTGVTVLTGTFNPPPGLIAGLNYAWDYTVTWENTVVTQTFNSLLAGMRPGEARQVAQGTTVDYVAPGGQNHLTLPPLYVSAPHIISLDPPVRTVGSGARAVFMVMVTNPAASQAVYSLGVSGFPAGWVELAETLPVPANSSLSVPLTVTIPVDASAASLPFLVSVTTSLGGADQVSGELNVAGALLQLEISPLEQVATVGAPISYTLTLTNLEPTARMYALSSYASDLVSLPAHVAVEANDSAAVAFTVLAASEGPVPFTVVATEINGGAQGQATAIITGEGFQQVLVTLSPATAPSGPGVQTLLEVTITNLGRAPDRYDLSAAAPAGWEAVLSRFGQPLSSLLVTPGEAHAVTLQLAVTPPAGAPPGDYTVAVTAQSPLVADTSQTVVQVGSQGVMVEILSGPGSLPPNGSGIWQVRVTNTGQSGDTFDLSAFGALGQFAQVNPASLTLAAGSAQIIQITVSGHEILLAGEYRFGIHAQSQAQDYIQDEAVTQVTIDLLEGVTLAWQPTTQTVAGMNTVVFSLIITNTGNTQAIILLSSDASGGASVQLSQTSLPLPAYGSAALLVTVTVPGDGNYQITATAASGAAQASDAAHLFVNASGVGRPMFLPLMYKVAP